MLSNIGSHYTCTKSFLCCLCNVCTGEVVKSAQKGEHFYKMHEFGRMSKGGKAYEWLCTKLIPCVVGSKVWNKKKNKETLSDIATASDESFVLLTLENNFERWTSEALWVLNNDTKEPDECDPKDFPASKYTNSGTSKRNGRSKRLQGWAREGYLRFNELHTLVSNDRLGRANFENELLEYWRKHVPVYTSTSSLATQDDEDDIYPANDLDGLVAPSRLHFANGTVADELNEDEDSENHSAGG
jgi:hypothetical protein